MKYIYSILLGMLFLFVGTSCEDEYRDIALFEGVEPIYQIGTCNNLVSSVSLYLTNPEGTVLGVDGGTGDYSLENSDNAVATVDFTESINGYKRIKVTPKMAGQTLVTIKDGSGLSAMLSIKVKEHMSYSFYIANEGFEKVGSDISDEEWSSIYAEIENNFTMKTGSRYEFIVTDVTEGVWSKPGKLLVYPDDSHSAPIEGTFEQVVFEGETTTSLRLCYNGEEHIFTTKLPLAAVTKDAGPASLTMWEEVTPLVPVELLPEGCRVFRGERWVESYALVDSQ